MRENSSSILSRNCSDIDWVFQYEPPFLHQSLPVCGDVIQPKMILQRQNQSCHLDPLFLPNNQTTDCVRDLLLDDDLDQLVVVIHGFLKSLSSSTWMLELSSALLNDSSKAVILVDWGRGSGGTPFPGKQGNNGITLTPLPPPDPFYYYQAAANTRYMGVCLARLLDELTDSLARLTNRLDQRVERTIHCVGHSLGAHICGFAGATLHTFSHTRLARISGLDPAGPLFAVDVPYPFNWLDISPAARLNRADAEFVDVIHTDGRARFPWSVVPQYGTMTKLGHLDFFPGAGQDFGWEQPGCWQFQDVGSCSHSRAHDLFISSLTTPCPALQSCSNSTSIPATCSNISSSARPRMGWWSEFTSLTEETVFTVNTTASPPFCGGVGREEAAREKQPTLLSLVSSLFLKLKFH